MNTLNESYELSDEDEALFAEFSNDFDRANNVFVTPFGLEVNDLYAEFRDDAPRSERNYMTDDELSEFSTFFNVAL